MTAAILLVAIVAEDPAVMRNAPRDDAAPQATLWRGDWLEVRGEKAGFLQVYDHRHERPGFIRPSIVRVHRLDEASAPELRAVVRFLRDTAGSESLGIGYAALYLRAAPAGVDASEVMAAIGTMASRLARRASARRADGRDAPLPGASPAASTVAAQIEVAESYGVHFRSVDPLLAGGRVRLCYDGDAWERVLSTPAAPALERARAALFFAGGECLDPATPAADRRAWNDRRIQALQSVDPAAAPAIPAYLGARVRLRHAEALAWRAFDEARRAGAGGGDAAARAEGGAIRELALVDRGVLAPEDLETYDDVAVRVAASRWASEVAPKPSSRRTSITVAPRAQGESCVRVVEGEGAKARVLAERCTFGVVWPSSLRWSAAGNVATLAVQPLPAWTELWVIQRGPAPANDNATRASVGASASRPTGTPTPAWSIEPLVAATVEPEAGYVEAAGFSPDGAHLLVVREARGIGHPPRRFQMLAIPALTVEKQANAADKLLSFKRWSAAWWRGGTLALR
jgi:hypothetical protein